MSLEVADGSLRKKVKPDLRLRDIHNLPARTSTSTDELRARAKRQDRINSIVCALFGVLSLLVLVAVILLLLFINGQLNFSKHSKCKGDDCAESTDYGGVEYFDTTTFSPSTTDPHSHFGYLPALDTITPLPGNLVPIAYSVVLSMTDVLDSKAMGTVTIDFDVKESTKDVVLNVDRQVNASVPKYFEIACEPKSATIITTDDSFVIHNRTAETVTFSLNSELQKGSRCRMSIDIAVTVTATMKGLFRVGIADKSVIGVLPLAFNGRRLFPCFDDSDSWRHVQISFEFTPPEGFKVLPLEFPKNDSGPHEIAMLVVPSVEVKKHNGIDFHFFTFSSSNFQSLFTAAYDFCAKFFGIKLSMKNIVIAAIPGLAGEEVVGRNFILYNKAIETDGKALAKVALRGMAKIWLMNAFSLNDWGSRFLYEGIGEYVSQQKWERYSNHSALERANNLFDGLYYDLGSSAPPVYMKTFEYKNEIEEFPLAISRNKASMLFNTFSEIITPEKFKDGIIAIVREGFQASKTIRLSPKQFLAKFKIPPEVRGPKGDPFDPLKDFYPMFTHAGFPVLHCKLFSVSNVKQLSISHPAMEESIKTPPYSVPIITGPPNGTKLWWTNIGNSIILDDANSPIDPRGSSYYAIAYGTQVRFDSDENQITSVYRRLIDTTIYGLIKPSDSSAPIYRIFDYIFDNRCDTHQLIDKMTRFVFWQMEVVNATRALPFKYMHDVCYNDYNETAECGPSNETVSKCHTNYCATKYVPDMEIIRRHIMDYVTSTDTAVRREAKMGINCVTNTTLIDGVLHRLFDDNFPKFYLLEALQFIGTNPVIRKYLQVFLERQFNHVFQKLVEINGLSSESLEPLFPGVTMDKPNREILDDEWLKHKTIEIPGLANRLALTHRQQIAKLIQVSRNQGKFDATYKYFLTRQHYACVTTKAITQNCAYAELEN